METKFLEHEIKRYESERENLLMEEGRFALIKGNEETEIYDSYDDALKIGYQKYGLEPFLVKKISRIDPVLNFTRNISVTSCRA